MFKARIYIGELEVLMYDVFALLSQTTSNVTDAYRDTDTEHTRTSVLYDVFALLSQTISNVTDAYRDTDTEHTRTSVLYIGSWVI